MKKLLIGDQRGLTHPLILLVLLIVIGGVGFGGWRVLHKDKTDKAVEKTATGSADAACLDFYHDQTLCDFATQAANFSKLAFTAVDNSVDDQGQTSQVTIKGDGQGNLSISSQTGNRTTDSIMIGNTTYARDGSRWIKYNTTAPALTGLSANLKFQFSNDGTPKDKQVKYKRVGTEKCGDTTCYKYQVSSPTTDATIHIWLTADGGRLQRMTIKNGNGTDDITVTYGPATITAPSPTITPAEASAATYESWIQSSNQNSQ